MDLINEPRTLLGNIADEDKDRTQTLMGEVDDRIKDIPVVEIAIGEDIDTLK